VHDITGDIKCIIAVHGNFNACKSQIPQSYLNDVHLVPSGEKVMELTWKFWSM